MIVSKTRNANGWETQQGNILPNGVKCNEKSNWVLVLRLITMNCSGEVIRQLQAYVLNLLFSLKFEHKCGFGDLLTFLILCTCNEGHQFYLNDM